MSRNPLHPLPPTGQFDDDEPVAETRAEFGRRLAQLLTERRWSQRELARRANLSKDAVNKYVRGMAWPEPKSLRSLSSVLGVPDDELLPHATARGMESEPYPALEIRSSNAKPGYCWLKVNQRVTEDQALAIANILRRQQEQQENGTHA
jgi:transcriptional regulator with XRE-family HTH domain